MPTHKVSELLVPATELSSREWISLIEEWVKVLGPLFKSTRFPRMGELDLGSYIGRLGATLQGDNIMHELHLDLEGIWAIEHFSVPRLGKGEAMIWGLDRDGNWYKGSVGIQSHSDGHRASYRLLSAEMKDCTLQLIARSIRPERIITEIRGQVATFQNLARSKIEHYDLYGQLLDEDLSLLKEAGIRIPGTSALTELRQM